MADENIGSVKISEEVIAGIASTAACEVEGVTRLSSKGVAAAKELVTEYKQIAKGVYAAAAPGVVNFCVGIVVENGVKVQKVSSEVQKKVKDAVETMTGLFVGEVNVLVVGVHTDKKPAAENND